MTGDGQLRAFIERVLRLKDEQDALAADIREVYAEAARRGISKTTLGMMVRDERQARQGWQVYFAIFPGACLLKIGISRNVERRLETLSYIRGEKAALLGSFPSTFPMEGWYHAQFGAFRLHGEYFALNDITRQMAREIIERETCEAEAA
ncbi:hypothetical protein ASD64_01440 [Mesorhizobium sp. Root157]|uniref:GapR family DNA-binding domain-containing protein n=1 Tax=Mesorhizobium sp. Root157 TaxID=1736477 RepID=UPI0006F944BD|nr:GapR family DNA-binding domain-containing protein [Mesorhizobium sp. Root157]KRA00264.1 hypothetical protein ASD64_01440 [Mesorhizobium sp. Root157]